METFRYIEKEQKTLKSILLSSLQKNTVTSRQVWWRDTIWEEIKLLLRLLQESAMCFLK